MNVQDYRNYYNFLEIEGGSWAHKLKFFKNLCIVIDTISVFCPQVYCTVPLKGMLQPLNISHYVVIKGTNATISSRLMQGQMYRLSKYVIGLSMSLSFWF